MTTEFAMTHIPDRMQELGIRKGDYFTRFHHFLLKPKEVREIEAYNEYYFLIDPPKEVIITSDMGVYDLLDMGANEMRYEHQGSISIENPTSEILHVKFIQVIIKNI